MSRRKKKNRKQKRRHHHHSLSGVAASPARASYKDTAKQGAIMLLAAIVGGGVGAALGKHSLFAGVPVTFYGVHKRNPYVIAAGLGLTMSNGFQNPMKTDSVQGLSGFDFKQFTDDAKDRIGTYFRNFSEKLYLKQPEVQSLPQSTQDVQQNLPSADQATAGLAGGRGYFMNPYNSFNGTGELDLSELDRIEAQVAAMNKQGTAGLADIGDDVDREF